MRKALRYPLAFACSLVALVVAFLLGFYGSLLLGANIHDILPGVSGLFFGLLGAVATFAYVVKRTAIHQALPIKDFPEHHVE